MKRNSIGKKLLLFASVIVLLFVGYVYYTVYTPVDNNNTENISIMIERGTSTNGVGEILKNKELIRCKVSFYGYVRLNGLGKDIIAGQHELNKGMTVPEILEAITTTPVSSEASVTIQEGLTISDIDEKLVSMNIIQRGNFEAAVKQFDDYESYTFIDASAISTLEFPLEGYLYPDTYFINTVDFKSDVLIIKMLDNFESKFRDLEPFFNAQERSMHDAITMASILQREVRTPDDLSIVAGILWKRFDSNWHIGADATILYATKKKNIDVEDLDFDSPYNTRLYVGMPPGPICNPDIEHIKATLTPEDSNYWYYLTTLDTGEVIYAETNDQHNVNKVKYLY